MDRAPYQVLDVHELLDSTLIMLSRKIGDGSRSSRTTTASLPDVPVYGAELNQVWTNLIDNAMQAMDGAGTLTIRTSRRDDDALQVEIGDTGPGIPDEIVGADLRAVLHDQAGRRRHRARPRHLVAHRRQQAPRRPVGARPSPGDTVLPRAPAAAPDPEGRQHDRSR